MKSILMNSRCHDLTVHGSGQIDISARVARRLELQTGDVVDVLHDDGGELYLYVKYRKGEYAGRHKGRVWAAKHGGRGTYRTWSKTLAEALLRAARSEGDLLRCPCGEEREQEGRRLITIIWRSNLK